MEEPLVKQFYMIYNTLLETKNQKEYVYNFNILLNTINNNLYKFVNVLHIKDLIFFLEEEQMLLAYKVTLYTYIKADLLGKIRNFCMMMTYLRDIYDANINLPEKMIKIENFLQKASKYIDAYKYISAIVKIEKDDVNIDKININNKTDIIWQTHMKTEIVERLMLLTNYFGHDIMRDAGVIMIIYNNVLKMNFSNIVKYYNDTVKKIRKYIEKQNVIRDAYVEIDKVNMIIIVSCDHTISTDKYNIKLDKD